MKKKESQNVDRTRKPAGKREKGKREGGNRGREGSKGSQKRRASKVVRCRVRSSVNNTKVVRTWYDQTKGRRVNRVKTAGMRGFMNSKRGSVYAGQEVRASAGKAYVEAQSQGGWKPAGVHVLRRGMGRVRTQALNELKKAGLEILTVSDATKDPHNGCRRKKKRRI
jgi:small subunit ribosomal protein S11